MPLVGFLGKAAFSRLLYILLHYRFSLHLAG
jgi:hypothetical protein